MQMKNKQIDHMLRQIEGQQHIMVKRTMDLCNINSGSYHSEGIRAVQMELKDLFAPLNATYEERDLPPIQMIDQRGESAPHTFPPLQIFRLNPHAPIQFLCTGHSDTVFPVESVFNQCRLADNRLHGPGTADMKGGLVVLFEALYAVTQSAMGENIGITVAISPEEEVGSPASVSVLTDLAANAHYGLTYEPSLPDGAFAAARKGSGNFTLVAEGKSAHAGREFFAGRNAIVALSDAAVQLSALSDQSNGLTVNVGVIHGGSASNTVPDRCICHTNIRIHHREQGDSVYHQMREIIAAMSKKHQCTIDIHGGFHRPPKPMTPQQDQLFAILKQCGARLDLPITWRDVGGCCEGNNLAAAGVPNIDTLGVRGAYIHSDKEYACVESFVERAQLSALFMVQLSEASV